MGRFRHAITLVIIIHSAIGINPCFDPSTDLFVCTPDTNRIDLEGCGVSEDDMDDLKECLALARSAGATELNLGYNTDIVLDDDFFTTTDENSPQALKVDRRPVLSFKSSKPLASTFFELALERFDARVAMAKGDSADQEEERSTLDHVQLIRVPKGGSTEASTLVRHLGGCLPPGPCCPKSSSLTGLPGGCAAENFPSCKAVTGCGGHHMGKKENFALEEPSVFSMSHMRDIVDRIVSGFLFGYSHAPECAKAEIVDYEKCFLHMTEMAQFNNIASRMFTGHDAYASRIHVCLQEENSEDCDESLRSVLEGTCNLNFIIITELWQSSLLLLFEALPWLRPTLDFFPSLQKKPDVQESNTTESGPDLETKEYVVSRRNDGVRHNEGMTHITPELREAARQANPVDDALHEFVSAKFCRQLQSTGLLDHPLVAEELATYELLHQRCTDDEWITATLEHFGPLVPDDCRLYQPFTHQ